ncbi:MAG TPA: ABC transporter permease [Acidimicrobiales bacterium]|nr:ABC transporter permease [Acidimicrobiales bacterium]
MSDRIRTLVPGQHALRVAQREAVVWRRFWHTSVLTGVLVPVMFVGAMGGGLGDLVDRNQDTVQGLSYLVFVTPGILAATTLQAATGSSMWPVMGGLKWNRYFHAAAATPVPPAQVYLGYLAWTGARLTLNATLFVLVAALLGAIPSPWGAAAVPFAALGGLAFAAPLCAYSAAQDSDLMFTVIFRVVAMPMFLFSGAFFPVEQLPGAAEPLAKATPLWHAVELCRGATTGTLGGSAAAVHLLVLAGYIAVGAFFGTRIFTSRLAA